MFGDTAIALIKELERELVLNKLPSFDENSLRQIFEEMEGLYRQNETDISAGIDNEALIAGLHFRHASLERNKQCVLAYLYHRIRHIARLRWTTGSVLSEEIKNNMTEAEKSYFNNYSKIVANYMQSSLKGHGIDLMEHTSPPKSLLVQVTVLKDYGEFETADGNVTALTKGTMHLLPRSRCESLIKEGVLEIVKSS